MDVRTILRLSSVRLRAKRAESRCEGSGSGSAGRPLLRFASFGIVVWILGLSACGGSSDVHLPQAIPTSTPDPSGFDPYTRISPAFDSLSDAKAHYGELDGGVYQIEVPEDWNGDLVIYFKGSNRFSRDLLVESPPLRSHFISQGYAWAATSYNTNLPISGDEARQAALLWDHFAQEFGRPGRTFAVADSAGGDGALVAMDEYPDRFDGALVACGVAGVLPSFDLSADLLAAGAYAAGVTQAEFDAGPLQDVVENRIVAVIERDPEVRGRFLAIWEQLSGGVRPFFVEGYQMRQDIWSLAIDDTRLNLSDNVGRVYDLGDAGIDDDDFNRLAIRVSRDPAKVGDPGDPTGSIDGPVILLHTTGDGIAPLSYAKLTAEQIQGQGKGDLLRVRVLENAYHCGFDYEDGIDAFDTLVRWVSHGEKPLPPYSASVPVYADDISVAQ